jgi:hypothetical protein
MFNFLKKRAKNKRHSTVDFYELNDQEMETLMGGSPISQLIGGGHSDTMLWPPSQRYDGSNYQSLLVPSFSPDASRQQHLDWVSMVEDKTPPPSKFYH